MRKSGQEKHSGGKPSRRQVRDMSDVSQKSQHKDVLWAGDEHVKQLIDTSPIAMVMASGIEERVEWVNNKFIELFGYTIEDMPDVEHWWHLAYPDETYRVEIKSQWTTKVEQAIRKKSQIEPMEATVRCKDGSRRYIEFCLSAIGEKHIVTFVDLTGRKRAEDELRQNREVALQFSEQLAALQEVTNELSKAESSDDLCLQAVQLGRSRLGFDRASIWFIEEHLGIMRGSFGTDERGELRDERNAQVEFRHEGLAWLLFSHKESKALVAHRPLYDHSGREVGVGDNAMAALWDGDQVIGVISVDNFFTNRPISGHQLEVLRLYATTLGHLITRKRTEEALRASENRFRVLSENAFVGIYIIQDGRLSYCNSTQAKIFGYTPEELTGADPRLLVHPDDQAMVLENIRRRIDGEIETIHYEFRGRCKDGSTKNIEVLGGRIDFGGKTAVIGNLMDITDRKHAEDILRESEEKYRTLIQKIQAAVVVHGADTQILTSNSMAQELLGLTEDQMLGKTTNDSAWHFFLEDGTAMPLEKYPVNQVLATRQALRNFIVRVHRPNQENNDVWVLVNADPVFGKEAELTQVIVTFVDITERKRVEEALRRSEQKFRALAENIPNVVFQCRNDSRYTFLYLNDAIEDLTGYLKEEFLEKGLSFLDLYHPDDLKTMPTPEANNITDINRNPFHITYRIRHKSGEWRWVDEWGTGVAGSADEVEVLEGIMVDITENKRHELEREAIITVSTALRRVTTRNEILNVILDQLVELFSADGATVSLPDPQTGGFVDEMGHGVVGEKMTGVNIPPGRGVCYWVMQNKRPYLNNQADRDPLFYRPDLLGNSRCVASVPLVAQEQAIGALWIARRNDLVEQDLRLLSAIADIAANALHRVSLHEQTVQQLHRLLVLHQIDLAISANFDLNVTLNVILKNVKDELEVDAASILLLDTVRHVLGCAAGIGFKTRRIEQSHVELGNGCAGRAAQEYRTVSYPDLNQAPGTFSRSALLTDEGFLSHYATPLIAKGQVKGVLETFKRKIFDAEPEWINYFETLATQAAIAIESASLFENLQRSNMELRLAYDATIEGWSRALDLRDRETEGHTQRVTEMVLALADRMGMSAVEKIDIRRGALLHDIGKMGVPDEILHKPGPLSDSEWEIMRQHPSYAYQMLAPIKYLKHALEIPYCHHEKWDGSGYPRELKGEEIPQSARMFAVVDVFDALTSDRPYRAAWSHEKTYHYIQEQAGRQFDPMVVNKFLEGR